MRIRKSDLRELVYNVYERNGAQVARVAGQGLIPGSRLKVTVGSVTRTVAVRTSLDREFSLTRDKNGKLATVPKVDEVAVVVPSASSPNLVEIFCFDKAVIVAAFDEAIADRQMQYPNISPKAPVFISLDDTAAEASAESGFKSKARWTESVPISTAKVRTTDGTETMPEFRERIRREFAALQSLPVEEVAVEFHIFAAARRSGERESNR